MATALLPGIDPEALFQLGPLAGRRIVVAMSGGVDSSVVAALAAASGAEAIGVTLGGVRPGEGAAADHQPEGQQGDESPPANCGFSSPATPS